MMSINLPASVPAPASSPSGPPKLASSHILIVDDDVRLAELTANYLTKQDFVTSIAHSAQAARHMLAEFRFDLVVMDVMMPGESGLDFVAAWRQAGDATPILLLTALGEGRDRIAGLEAGADDYLSKPFEPRELVLRIEGILRRQANASAGALAASASRAATLKLGVFHYDVVHKRLWRGSELVPLTSKESNIMSILAENLGKPVTRQALYEGMNPARSGASRLMSLSEERAIDVAISRLRRKFEANPKHPLFLQTVHGKGYTLTL